MFLGKAAPFKSYDFYLEPIDNSRDAGFGAKRSFKSNIVKLLFIRMLGQHPVTFPDIGV